MASNSGAATQAQIQQQQQQHQKHFQTNGSPHHCKECGLFLNSAESLEVHLQYHKENLLNKWATQGATSQQQQHSDETNNNTTVSSNSKALCIKREFSNNSTISAAADSSDSMFKNRNSPELILGHPPTPQSFTSSSSPYQNPENSFSPGFQNYQPIKTERSSPSNFQSYYHDNNQYFENSQLQQSAQQQQQHSYPQEYAVHKMSNQSTYRYHPYQQQNYERNPQVQVSSSSPVFPPQPTPSPSPKQCDKCGYVCESASQLIEHLNVVHPSTPTTLLHSYQQKFLFGNHHQIKTETDSQSEILDLDSHKVHQVFPEDEKQQNNGDDNVHNPHSVSAMLSSWTQQHTHGRQEQFPVGADQKPYQNGMTNEGKLFQADQKLFRSQQQMPGLNEYLPAGVTTTSDDGRNNLTPQQTYRPFEHIPPAATGSVISSTQIPTPSVVSNTPAQSKGANWKSNEARRPKTYNCTACNKWFTSSGHLKRHYNTTLHKNAVKSSGQPDPATLPISAHHHPARDNASRNEVQSPDPMEEPRSEDSLRQNFERPPSIPGLLQQATYNPGMQSPLNNLSNHNSLSNSSISNLSSSASPPNGEAGPSAITNIDSRGLLSLPSTPSSPFTSPIHQYMVASPSHHHMMPAAMDNTFQMYPNGSAPHVMQVTATNSHNTTGELIMATESQPLPSFAQIQAHRFGLLLGYGAANVGGVGPVTGPFTTTATAFYHEPYVNDTINGENRTFFACRPFQGDLQQLQEVKITLQDELTYSQPNHNNNNLINLQNVTEDTDHKLHIIENIKTEFDSRPSSPKQLKIKKVDYEESTGSPLISSTVQSSKQNNSIHKCFDCDKMFNKACYLTQHNKTFHSGDKPFKCTRCGKRFSCEKQYQDHSTKHAGEKPYKCDLCPKQFNHKTDLRRHMCLHTGQKPYACDTCGKGFIRKDHMLKHCDTHTRRPASKVATVR